MGAVKELVVAAVGITGIGMAVERVKTGTWKWPWQWFGGTPQAPAAGPAPGLPPVVQAPPNPNPVSPAGMPAAAFTDTITGVTEGAAGMVSNAGGQTSGGASGVVDTAASTIQSVDDAVALLTG